ncbi:MAG: hypothetical protein J0H29_01395 [Sphingobacteriales bacterium]|nr:hypothetical protein [Sphingobacteriales bacterium]OJY89317.1 MAG: hypothetical protein BGP14_05280 [Sphingobacteriales bacterium 44-15]
MFCLQEFNRENFAEALSNRFTPADTILRKKHFEYLMKYLGPADKGLGAKIILIEDRYISKDFLHDYAAYYALCFEKYDKECRRIHLFNQVFTEEEFKNVLLSTDEGVKDSFWSHYLGNIVVKPIPVTVIGTTILQTYTHDGEFGRNYWGLKDYSINVFGTRRTIRSLVFQEQDKVLAACATTAIWSTLNKTFPDYQTAYKSPSQITREADNTSHDGSRLFPNKGLDILQICHAIEQSGLVCEVLNNGNRTLAHKGEPGIKNSYLKEIVRAYSPVGIPIILIIKISDYKDLHAITLVGHRHNGPFLAEDDSPLISMADNIDRLYAHDDQWGPFVRITFAGNECIITPWNEELGMKEITNENEQCNKEEVNANNDNDGVSIQSTTEIEQQFIEQDTSIPVTVNVTDVILSLYPKIRISYLDIKPVALGVSGIFREFTRGMYTRGLTWDIRLLYSEQYKAEIKKLNLSENLKLDLIARSMPKFIWVVTSYTGLERISDFTFDATGVRNAMNGLEVLTFIEGMRSPLHLFINANRELFDEYYNDENAPRYFDWLLSSTK